MASAPVDLGGVESESEQTSMAQESVVGDGPRFLSDDQQESSWLASHKYMLVAIIIAIVIILALFVAR